MAKKTKEEKTEETTHKIGNVEATFVGDHVLAESNDITRDLHDKTRYGEPSGDKKFQYALIEALLLIERGIFVVKAINGKDMDFDTFLKEAIKVEPNFWIRYCVYSDLRKRGYIVKTALKFGADFRVYDRGVKPGEDHAKWVVFPVSETATMTWFEFAAKNRVAHSTKKRLLLAIVDAEAQVTFYECHWLRP